ncbi:MAG: hypothetical protein OSB68_09750 [Dehalococcoidia bacterium]|nr:hypothetical protein [Dehalococcoidia bacterium]
MATTEPSGRFEGKVGIAVERSVVHHDEVETPQRLRLHRAASGALIRQDINTQQIIEAQSILSQPDTKHDTTISTQAMCIPSAMIRCQ